MVCSYEDERIKQWSRKEILWDIFSTARSSRIIRMWVCVWEKGCSYSFQVVVSDQIYAYCGFIRLLSLQRITEEWSRRVISKSSFYRWLMQQVCFQQSEGLAFHLPPIFLASVLFPVYRWFFMSAFTTLSRKSQVSGDSPMLTW